MVQDLLDGTEAVRRRNHDGSIGGPSVALTNVTSQQFAQLRGYELQSPYLPKLPNEKYGDYDRRLNQAFLTNVYSDISSSLAAKPFSKTCDLSEGAPKPFVDFSENVDGLGNSLHVFASVFYKTAQDKGITWILVEYTKVPKGTSAADERGMGARPYWVHVPPEKLLAVYSKFVNGTEVIYHARIDESCVELEGYEEKKYKRIRQLDREVYSDESGTVTGFGPVVFVVLEEVTTQDSSGRDVKTWTEIDGGDMTIKEIPLVPFVLGTRKGTTWEVSMPLVDLAYMEIKLFQMESGLDYIKEMTAFPMLCGSGISSVDSKGAATTVPVGPRSVLFAPPDGSGTHGTWSFIEPGSQSLVFLQDSIERHKDEMRNLGMQPLMQAAMTVITTANISLRAHSAVQAWAIKAKDSLEQAMKITGEWMLTTDIPEVHVHTDFGVDMQTATELPFIQSLNAAGVLSDETTREETKRRGILSDDFDETQEKERLAEEHSKETLLPEKHIDPRTGNPVVVTPKEGRLNPPPAVTPPRRRTMPSGPGRYNN